MSPSPADSQNPIKRDLTITADQQAKEKLLTHAQNFNSHTSFEQ